MKNGLKGVTDATVFCKSMHDKNKNNQIVRSMKSYEVGGATGECAGPGDRGKGCRKKTKYKSSGRSSSGGEATLVGKIAGGLAGVGAALGLGKYVKNNKD
jgi:hypothetical protein